MLISHSQSLQSSTFLRPRRLPIPGTLDSLRLDQPGALASVRLYLLSLLLDIASTNCFIQAGALVDSGDISLDRLPARFQPSTSIPGRIDGP